MTGQEKVEARKLKILDAAAKVFAEKGFQEATVSEIANAAGTSEATIYDYFATKEGLLFSIPIGPVQQLRETAEFHLKLIKGAVNKIRAFLYLQLLFYRNNPDFASVLMLILKQNRRFLDTQAHKMIREFLKIFDQVIKEGTESGELRSDIDPYLLRSAGLGAIEHVTTNWLMLGQPDDDEFLQIIDPMVDTLIMGIQHIEKSDICPLARGKGKKKGPTRTPCPNAPQSQEG